VDHDEVRANLSAYRDGELNERLREQIALHVRACGACREELREFDRIDSLVRELPEIIAPENFTSEVIAKARAGFAPRPYGLSLPRRVLERFVCLADSVFALFAGYEIQDGTLDEFGDFPPLSLGYAYFQLIGR
jgi:anti-sigma factor RsiW